MNLPDIVRRLKDIAAKANDAYTTAAGDPNLQPIAADLEAILEDIEAIVGDLS